MREGEEVLLLAVKVIGLPCFILSVKLGCFDRLTPRFLHLELFLRTNSDRRQVGDQNCVPTYVTLALNCR